MVGIGPTEFWGLTLHDLDVAIKGYNDRIEVQQNLAAWHVCHMMRCWVSKKDANSLTPAKLLGKTRQITDPDQYAREAILTWLGSEEYE